ncbi:protein LSM12 homolog A-like [Xenia sp. Carnegie-2017]|uniref:protein LSM12 homolog A-like n=1 Tax=Xenia sp. Carnegie-2017 TaxID=2897299 RepID=UPI001F03EC12|nr:protein LSM12 homolog A-like [Xenia sp. Carnegie-2017]
MAAGSICPGNQPKLGAGSRVSCTSLNGEKVEGEVLAYDGEHKILVLKIPSGEKGKCNINFFNTEILSDFKILEEAKKSPSPLPALDMSKIAQRTEQNLAQRQRQLQRIGNDVTPMAQKLFDHVSKQYNNCCWDGKNIVVKDADVKIIPPYELENVVGDTKGSDHIKKLVERFQDEQIKAH